MSDSKQAEIDDLRERYESLTVAEHERLCELDDDRDAELARLLIDAVNDPSESL